MADHTHDNDAVNATATAATADGALALADNPDALADRGRAQLARWRPKPVELASAIGGSIPSAQLLLAGKMPTQQRLRRGFAAWVLRAEGAQRPEDAGVYTIGAPAAGRGAA